MAIDSVNSSSNNNAGLYAAGATVVGGGAGAGVAYMTKPFLKDGAPTDSFELKTEFNILSDIPEYKDHIEKQEKLYSELKKIKDKDALRDFINSGKAGHIPGRYLKEIEKAQDLSMAKSFVEISMSVDEHYKIREIVDANNVVETSQKACKDFIKDKTKISSDTYNAVKKAARSIQNKYALIYGAIGAGVLGLGTLLCCSGKKQPQGVDQQA